MPWVQITLNSDELANACDVGCRRQMQALRRGYRDRHGFDGSDGNGWNVHIEGAAGEIAVAKALNVYWSGSATSFREGGDVGALEVRTRSKHTYDLILRQSDPRDRTYFLVTGLAPVFRVHGWIVAEEGMLPEFWKNHGDREPAWFVPQASLYPVSTFRNLTWT